jgi:Glutamine synthetase, catalytic domain
MGAFPCFMPKPFMGVSANGCHHNISLWQGDESMFLPQGDDPRKPSKVGMHAIGGVLGHLRALTLGRPRPWPQPWPWAPQPRSALNTVIDRNRIGSSASPVGPCGMSPSNCSVSPGSMR